MREVNHQKNIIEVKNISFAYGDEEVLRDISIDVHQGDYLGFVGPNGAGKTTLMKIILGLLAPKTGSIKLFGQDIQNFKDWQKISYVPQGVNNFDNNFPATVLEIVLMGRYGRRGLFKNINAGDKKIAEQAISQVGLSAFKNRLIGDLSGGQKQRAFIARALAAEPEVIFLDEPTAGVDQKSQDKFYALLKKMNEELGITLVLISHDVERLLKEAMHIACIDHTLTCHASPEEFLRESAAANILGEKVKIIAHHHNDN
ncbi:MAG TPA: metal ABC transporter ATP-binding protein [Candidatus Nanoarchaeia archaeon]|nr:metal ABC transporter ATP-binding protein [Candidatus Nanoarchaeia archaeon]